MANILECRGLVKKYGSFIALNGLNFAVPEGRIVGLLGTNGSGKTTLINLAAGLLRKDGGEILIGGNPPSEKTKMDISYLPERTYLYSWMKVRDILDLFADFYSDFDRNKAVDMLRALHVDTGLKLRTLSKGTKEKVQLVLVMSRRARLYLLDEPIGGVDPATRDYILNTIISNYNPDSSVLISTHLISDIENILDDFYFIHNGQVFLQGSAEELRNKEGKTVDQLFREVFRC